jgi:hypothetical protein
VSLDVGVASVLGRNGLLRLGVERLLLLLLLLLRRVVHSLGMVRRLLLVKGDALLGNGVVVRLDLRLHLDLEGGGGDDCGTGTGTSAAAVASVSMDDDGVGYPCDEEEEAALLLVVLTLWRGEENGESSAYNSMAPRPAMPATTPPNTFWFTP